MLIHCFSSEDFKPKRLVYKGGAPAPDASQEPPRGFIRPGKKREAGGGATGTEQYGDAPESVRTAVGERVKDKAALRMLAGQLAETGQDYIRTNWRGLNTQFAELMNIGEEKASPDMKVRALQRLVFGELGLNDPAAVIDGKLGPYTLAALARYAELPANEVAALVPPGATTLAANVADYGAGIEHKSEAELKALEQTGTALFGTTTPQPDGSYLVMEGSQKTYFRFVDGKWMWASEAQKTAGTWFDVGTNRYKVGPNDPLAKVNAMADKLMERSVFLRSAGAGLLDRATPQPDGSYLIETGTNKTYFRFVDGKWMWASQRQKDKPNGGEWVDVGTGRYEVANPGDALAEVNAIADRLAAEVRTTKETEAGKMRTALAEAKQKNPQLDTENAYVVKVGDNYEVRTWQPIKAGVQDVQRVNRDNLNTQKVGQTVMLDIDGVKVPMTYVRTGVWSVAGGAEVTDMQAMYRKAIEIAQKNRGEKPNGTRVADIPAESLATNAISWLTNRGAMLGGMLPGFFRFFQPSSSPTGWTLPTDASPAPAGGAATEPVIPTAIRPLQLDPRLAALGSFGTTPWGGTDWSAYSRSASAPL